MVNKVGTIGSTTACRPRDPRLNPSVGKLVWANFWAKWVSIEPGLLSQWICDCLITVVILWLGAKTCQNQTLELVIQSWSQKRWMAGQQG